MPGPFNVGDLVLFGKYKNKRGRIVSFGTNPKGQTTVEIEPVPKGRKSNKVMGLYKIWTAPQEEEMYGEDRFNRLVEEMLEHGLAEAAPRRVRRRQPGKGSHKMTKVCPKGMHMKGGRCVKVPLGKLHRTARLKAKKRRTGKGQMAIKRQQRYAKRFNR